ncbi:acetyl/propionyl/methylcrotonyl-CoA carboxylase subunit alpha [Spongorhabdus nitratireducens]
MTHSSYRQFNKILIANRGEIALRIIRTAKAQGYQTVAVYSEADQSSPHVTAADEAVLIGPAPVTESYLDAGKIFAAAELTGADAVHPGYGFLSENADFARACADRNIVFIGPPADAVELMGSKRLSKIAMQAAGVPCIPGYEDSDQSDERLISEAITIGFPLMIKASAGGGGRGMRVASSPEELPELLRSARNEALNAFGSSELILEKQVIGARHVEIQVFADHHGNVVHLGERDCSVQRRHQKVLEEAPSPAVDEALRARMGEAAVQAALACNYRGAGTVEFLLTSSGEFYFLEMNTRLQVEHPVTELVTGLDLVSWQLDVAAGYPLPLRQHEINLQGHAIEARLYAEDPESNFLPQTGYIHQWLPASGDGIRIDAGIQTGQTLSPHYDPMLAKVIAYGRDRSEALRKLNYALQQTSLLGVTTNRSWLARIVRHPVFASGDFNTDFLTHYGSASALQSGEPPLTILALAAVLSRHNNRSQNEHGWSFSHNAPRGCRLALANNPGRNSSSNSWNLDITGSGPDSYQVTLDNQQIELAIYPTDNNTVTYHINDIRRSVKYLHHNGQIIIDTGESYFCFEDRTLHCARAGSDKANGRLCASMDGQIIATLATPGEQVSKGQTVVVLEAMKMEHPLTADCDGVLSELQVSAGDQVKSKQLLATITPAEVS